MRVCNILPMTENSIVANPVTLLPGRAQAFRVTLSDGFGAAGDDDRNRARQFHENREDAATDGQDDVWIEFHEILAAERMKSMLSPVQRSSNCALMPDVQPNFRSSSRNARTRSCISLFVGGYGISTPMRRIRSACCARAATGHVAAAPPMTLMKSRRLIACPQGLKTRYRIGLGQHRERGQCPLWVISGHFAMRE